MLIYSKRFRFVERKRDQKNKSRFLYLASDYQYLESIRNKDLSGIEERINDLEKMVTYFKKFSQTNSDTLFVLTTGNSVHFDFPKSGKQWRSFQRRGKYLTFGHSSLQGQAFAFGPGAENFCGIFEESDLLRRVLWSPEDRAIIDLFDSAFKH